MWWIFGIALLLYIASMAEGSNVQSKRTKRLDPGGRDDFGGRF